MQQKKRRILTTIFTLALCMFAFFAPRFALADPKIVECVLDSANNQIKLYVRGSEDEIRDAKLEIGGASADILETFDIAEDTSAPRTVVMLDNSLSNVEFSLDQYREILAGMVDDHMEGESFRIALISDKLTWLQDTYISDYTAIKSVFDGITPTYQDTYLAEVLYETLTNLEQSAYDGYVRIVLMADGVDTNVINVTGDELDREILRAGYPIYTVGKRIATNEQELERLFSISRMTGADYGLMEDDQPTDDLQAMLTQDREMRVIRARIPKTQTAGQTRTAKLTLSDGTVLMRDFDASLIDGTTGENRKASGPLGFLMDDKGKPSLVAYILVGVVVIIVTVIVSAIILKTRREKPQVIQTSSPDTDSHNEDPDKSNTSGVSWDTEGGRTVRVTPADRGLYTISLTDVANPGRTFVATTANYLTVGRKKDRSIWIHDDPTAGREQCELIVHNGSLYVRDAGSTNPTRLNGHVLEKSCDVPVTTGSTLTIGSYEYRITFTPAH